MNRNTGKKIADRLKADPQVQAMRAASEFEATIAVSMVVDFNDLRSDYCRVVVERWCLAQAAGRWRRRVIQRRGTAILDRIVIEFADIADAHRLEHWLAARGW